ncbi:unnamed protein product [Anisakis simplex]|uniref:Protein SZT2 (inferred by orthology to a human protein) n=1 Tax=Anisakis simplex TaxID=6269 RepID=A0A0M3KF12_ANISI|nr:unnamed protein product [Anisakis simplex]
MKLRMVTAKENDGNKKMIREAQEVVLLMKQNCRVSRNIRALWFFEHLNSNVSLRHTSNTEDLNNDELEVVGMIAKDGLEIREGEELKVCSDTVVTYLSKLYRFVFVLDVSPSVVVAYNFPGTKRQFSAELYVSVCVYSPFICFDGDTVIIQGVHINGENVERVLRFIDEELKSFINSLCNSMRIHLRRWNHERRRVRKEADELIPGTFFRQPSIYPDDEKPETSAGSLDLNEPRKISTTAKKTSDEGFIQPEWSLIFMLRMGLLGIQMLPENTQSSWLLSYCLL